MKVVRRSGAMWQWYKMRLSAGEKCFYCRAGSYSEGMVSWESQDLEATLHFTPSRITYAYNDAFRIVQLEWPADALG
jgi:hypothetical protein